MIIGLLGYGLNAPIEHELLATELGTWIGKRSGTIICGGFQGTLAAGISSCIKYGGAAEIILESDRVENISLEWLGCVRSVKDTFNKHELIGEKVDFAIAIGGGQGSLKLMKKVTSHGKMAFVVKGLVNTYDELGTTEELPLKSILQQIDNSLNY